jgi:hypothetical protein
LKQKPQARTLFNAAICLFSDFADVAVFEINVFVVEFEFGEEG